MDILLIIDMQNDFVNGCLANTETHQIIPTIVDLCKQYSKNNIYATRDTHYSNYLSTLEGMNLPIKHCIKDTKGWQLIDELIPFINVDHIIDKSTFGSIELVKRMQKLAMKHRDLKINIVGVCTDICVINNALMLRSMLPEIEINVIAEGCAASDYALQKNAFEIMRVNHINII